jgi:FAD/FMN-containing dehydrogenase
MSLEEKLTAILGKNGVITDVSDMAPYLHEERGLVTSKADIVARPATTQEVSAVVCACAESKTSIVAGLFWQRTGSTKSLKLIR